MPAALGCVMSVSKEPVEKLHHIAAEVSLFQWHAADAAELCSSLAVNERVQPVEKLRQKTGV